MRDPLDDTLAGAGEFLRADGDLNRALDDLVEARAVEAGVAKPRHARKIAPVVAIGLALAVASGGAVAATQWGPWAHVFEPDVVVARDWTDASGTFLGSCETHFVIGSLPADTRVALRDYLGSLDVDSLEPDGDVVAAELDASHMRSELQDRLDEIVGPDIVRSDNSQAGRDEPVDARVLQSGLVHAVSSRIVDELRKQHSGLDIDRIATLTRTECTTDPGRSGDQ